MRVLSYLVCILNHLILSQVPLRMLVAYHSAVRYSLSQQTKAPSCQLQPAVAMSYLSYQLSADAGSVTRKLFTWM